LADLTLLLAVPEGAADRLGFTRVTFLLSFRFSLLSYQNRLLSFRFFLLLYQTFLLSFRFFCFRGICFAFVVPQLLNASCVAREIERMTLEDANLNLDLDAAAASLRCPMFPE
jgi:hypothetical protein